MHACMGLPEVAWYLLQCKPRQDARAMEHLTRQGFHGYSPTMWMEAAGTGKAKRARQPIFPGYIFIRMREQDSWSALRSTRGVSRIVSFNGKPCRVEDGLVDHLKQRCATGSELRVLMAGERVQIKQGPFAELDAVFKAMDGSERVILLLNILNREQIVRVPITHLSA